MKQKLALFAAAALALALTPGARAALYTDTTGDLNNGVNGGDVLTNQLHLDIISVEVTNDFFDLVFKINLAGNPFSPDWGKYCIGFDTNAATGDFAEFGNGSRRHISMTQGMDFWVGSWVDGTPGSQLFWYDGAAWNNVGGTSISKTTSNVTIKVALAKLSKTYGDSIDFDVYTTGANADPAIDSLANPNVAVTNWAQPYSSGLAKTYTIVVPPLPSTNSVKFMVNMEIPIWEYDNAIGDGFNTNTDSLYVRGSFNGWSSLPGYQLFQVGPTLFSNTVEVVQYIGQNVTYKFYGQSFPGYESPALTCGNDRSLTITSPNMTVPTIYWSDRKLSDPTRTVTFFVDMSLQNQLGKHATDTDTVRLPGSFNNWQAGPTGVTMTQGTGSDTNIYSATVSFEHYPAGTCGLFYKFFTTSPTARNTGWESPISTSSGDRSFTINSLAQTNTYYYNDETPIFNITSVQKLDADSAKVTWQSFPSRNNIPVGGQYAIVSRDSVTDAWTTNGTVNSTASSSTFTNTGLIAVPSRFYRALLIGL